MARRLLFALVLLVGGMVAFAEGTLAGQTISNTARVTYFDSAGNNQSLDSNTVTTEVLSVYGISITPSGSESAPGQTQSNHDSQTVTFTYALTNNANEADDVKVTLKNLTGNDDFDLSDLRMYVDVDGDGTVGPGDTEIPSVHVFEDLGVDATVNLIVVGTIPTGAAAGSVANINLEGSSQKDSSVTDVDNVAQAKVLPNAELSVTKAAANTVDRDGEITYTVSGSNGTAAAAFAVTGVVTVDGSAKTGIFVKDVFPAELTYVAGSLTGTATAGSALMVYSTDSGATWTATQPTQPATVTAVGLLIEGSDQFFTAGATYSFTFKAKAPADALSGAEYENTATLRYDANGNGDSSDTGETKTSDKTTTTVNQAVGITFTQDATGTAVAPDQVVYTHTVVNGGNATATVSIPAVTGAPSGWTYEYSTDGGATWTATVVDLSVDAYDSHEVRVRVSVPANAADEASHTATITATGAYPGGAGSSDHVTDKTTVVIGVLEIEKVVDKSGAQPGETITYTVTATNTGSAALTGLVVTDSLPEHTEFVSVSAVATGFSGSLIYKTGTTWTSSAPTALADGGTFSVAVDTNGDSSVSAADTMPAGATLTITFKVKVK